MSDVVLFEERPAENGFIGHATLNRPEKLNTLTTEMIALLHQQFSVWADDPACKAVFLDGAGEKAFCAGGDVVAVTTDPSPDMAVGREFFKTEYDLNFFMHTFPKPMLVWGGGICMGGGFGLLQGSSTRIVSDTSRLAMPELAIGFHPDVGGSWFLQRVSAPLGEVIALTGVHFSGADAVELGLADVLVANDAKGAILEALSATDWSEHARANRAFAEAAVRGVAAAQPPAISYKMMPHRDRLAACMHTPYFQERWDNLVALAQDEDPFLKRVGEGTSHGSPASAFVVQSFFQRTRHAGLRDCLDAELALSMNLLEHGDFREGVRALLVDKDRSPDWAFKAIREVDIDWMGKVLP